MTGVKCLALQFIVIPYKKVQKKTHPNNLNNFEYHANILHIQKVLHNTSFEHLLTKVMLKIRTKQCSDILTQQIEPV